MVPDARMKHRIGRRRDPDGHEIIAESADELSEPVVVEPRGEVTLGVGGFDDNLQRACGHKVRKPRAGRELRPIGRVIGGG